MPQLPAPVSAFLAGRRFAVAGVARDGKLPANFILKKLRASGYEAIPVNPGAAEIDGTPCYPDLASIPGELHGVVVATHPKVSAEVVRQAGARGVKQVWFHRSFGGGSVSAAALRECEKLGITPIVGGCPLMYCEPVDVGHRCIRWWLRMRKRVPG
jgi:predicted CoA-binding protein